MMERTTTRSRMGMDRRTFICLFASLAVTQAHVALTFPPARSVPSLTSLIVLKNLDLPSSRFSPIVGQISILGPSHGGLTDLFPQGMLTLASLPHLYIKFCQDLDLPSSFFSLHISSGFVISLSSVFHGCDKIDILILTMYLAGTLTWTSLIQYEQKRPVECQKVCHPGHHHHRQGILDKDQHKYETLIFKMVALYLEVFW